MAISQDHSSILEGLRSPSWPAIVEAIVASSAWMNDAPPGDVRSNAVIHALEPLATHSKWEVRHALVRVAEENPAEAFDRVLALLVEDSHARVKASAARAVVRRKDRRRLSVLDQQHAERVMTILDDVEKRYGLRVRQAAQRAAEDVGNTFARELHHEIVKLLAPLMLSAERIRSEVGSSVSPRVSRELERIDVDVQRLNAVLDGMREYAHTPQLEFSIQDVSSTLIEAVDLARTSASARIPIEIDASDGVTAEIARSRLVQALRNVLTNACEAYPAGHTPTPIRATARGHDGYVVIGVEDRGTGMSTKEMEQARQLFATTKATGTGFGLPLAIRVIETEHNGRLSIDSRQGYGTSVTITLPTIQP